MDGATPYAIDELAYDHSVKDGRLCIAAVARETLAEAEAFANEHQFNPLNFVAIPEAGDYDGEPHFGLTGNARDQDISEDSLLTDAVPIRIIGSSKLPEPQDAGAEKAKETDAAAAPKPSENAR